MRRYLLVATVTAAAVLIGPIVADSVPAGAAGPARTVGRELWKAHFPADASALADAMAVSPHGRTLFVIGENRISRAAGAGYQTVAYQDGTGKRLWVSRYHAYQLQSLAMNPHGTAVYLTGWGYGHGFATVAYKAATGQQLWSAGYGKANYDLADLVAASPDGTKVFVTGSLESGEYLTIAYRS